MTSLSWRTLESRVPFDELPALHRRFLVWRGVEGVEEMPLRRVQQRTEAELNKMAMAGEIQKTAEDWLLPADVWEALGIALP